MVALPAGDEPPGSIRPHSPQSFGSCGSPKLPRVTREPAAGHRRSWQISPRVAARHKNKSRGSVRVTTLFPLIVPALLSVCVCVCLRGHSLPFLLSHVLSVFGSPAFPRAHGVPLLECAQGFAWDGPKILGGSVFYSGRHRRVRKIEKKIPVARTISGLFQGRNRLFFSKL